MSSDLQSPHARRYLLGTLTEEDAATVEQEYFNDPEALERLAATEDELIEDYLDNRLPPDEREQFERAYLAAPHHRRRVETIRQLRVAACRIGSGKAVTPVAAPTTLVRWLAAAAALVLAATAGVWFARSGDRPGMVAENQTPASTSIVPPADRPTPGPTPGLPLPSPQIFALSISPTTVRTGSGAPSIVIPSGTDVIALNLEGEATQRAATGRASVRTVVGDEVWQGPTTAEGALADGVVAHVRVPAGRLPVDDYVITLVGTDAAGVEREVYRYFLRVRAR